MANSKEFFKPNFDSPESNPRNVVIGTDRIRTCNPMKAGRLANGFLGQSDLFQM